MDEAVHGFVLIFVCVCLFVFVLMFCNEHYICNSTVLVWKETRRLKKFFSKKKRKEKRQERKEGRRGDGAGGGRKTSENVMLLFGPMLSPDVCVHLLYKVMLSQTVCVKCGGEMHPQEEGSRDKPSAWGEAALRTEDLLNSKNTLFLFQV